ncbi:YnbE family lipoprotein [Croceicoccus sp. BE223]|uniref:YnbE family lipoprotein n=1 Tax=Croceicoccus sp. BE223 TaxID=2817716 RepID=UPI00285EB781|nr:YnbE family lipoprotein [Croceicoccus sp. BE223]MDR7103468.1 anti-sigma-K factor RskA [Croceicoccus sp. BE223]
MKFAKYMARWRKKAGLTATAADANTAPMAAWANGWRRMAGMVAIGLAPATTGACVNVNAPAEPIVIELNVNIKQEVLYRLVDSANENIEENPEIF